MGCHHSKNDDDVFDPNDPVSEEQMTSNSTENKGGNKRISKSKSKKRNTGRKTKQTRAERVTVHDLASDIVQHQHVNDISECFEFDQAPLGAGHFGCVEKAVSRKSGKEWAIKVVKLNNEVDNDALRNEIKILKRLHHPQIVRVISSYEDKEQMYMVMQLVKGKELYDYLYREHRKFTEDEVRKIIKGVLRAVAFLHSNFITHRDLKLENLLLQDPQNCNSIKLCDFGLSTRFKKDEKLQKSLGTIDYVAPEVLDGEYNEKCDLWSIGVICYELLTGISPFHAPTIDETMGKIFDGALVFEDAIWKNYSPCAISFIKALVQEDVEKRLSAEQALDHKWIKGECPISTEDVNKLQDNKRLLLTNMLSFSRCRKMKQTALLSVALGISEDHIQQEMAAEVFHSMDRDKNGTLSRDEFCSSMEECGISTQDANDLFTRIDQSKTGNINFLEFMAAVMDQRDIGQNTIKEAFGLLDGEKNGRISIVGLKDVFKNSLMADDVKEMIQSADTKGEGYVDFDEFKQMFQNPSNTETETETHHQEGFMTSSGSETEEQEHEENTVSVVSSSSTGPHEVKNDASDATEALATSTEQVQVQVQVPSTSTSTSTSTSISIPATVVEEK